jgi:LysM repeat protein
MSLRLTWCLLSAGLFIILIGCDRGAGAATDEQKNPHFIVGRERITARDYRGAIDAFERALEVNPRSGLAHFELGLLYESHNEADENHLISAMYHYKRCLDLRPTGHPSDQARMRMAGCKQELVKSESLAPVYQTMQRDLERLKDENKFLKAQLETVQGQSGGAGNNVAVVPNPRNVGLTANPNTGRTQNTGSSLPRNLIPANATSNTAGPRVTPLPPTGTRPTRSYTVKQGDTLAAIARAQGIKLESLQAANPGVNANKMRNGAILVIPPK